MVDFQNEIRDLILNVQKEIVRNRRRDYDNQWKDANPPGIIISCEALLAFLIPAAAMPELRDEMLSIVSKETIIETLFGKDQVLGLCKDEFYGSPYIDFSSASGGKGDLGFLDSASFVVSTVYLVSRLLGTDLDKNQLERIEKTFERGLTFIKESFVEGQGWSWGTFDKPDEAFLYCTWTAVECLTDLLQDRDAVRSISPKWKEFEGDVEGKLNTAREYLERAHIDSPKEGMNITEGTVSYEPTDTYLNYNLYAVVSLLLLGSKKNQEIEKAIDVILSEFKKSEKVRRRYLAKPMTFYFDSKTIIRASDDTEYKDRAFLPLLLKALSLFIKENPKESQKYEKDTAEVYKELLRNRDFGRYQYVWDKYAEKDSGYAIYYTERAIEALVRLYEGVRKPDKAEVPVSQQEGVLVKLPTADLVKVLFTDPDFLAQFRELAPRKTGSDATVTEELRAFKQEMREIKTSLAAIEKRVKKMESVSVIKDAMAMDAAQKRGKSGDIRT